MSLDKAAAAPPLDETIYIPIASKVEPPKELLDRVKELEEQQQNLPSPFDGQDWFVDRGHGKGQKDRDDIMSLTFAKAEAVMGAPVSR